MHPFARHPGSIPRLLGVTALCVALGACVSVAVPPLPTGDLPAHWRNAPQLGAAPDLTGWWQHFHDAELDALVTTALHDNLDVQQARLKLRAARALEDAAATAFKPQLAFNTLEQPNAENTASYFQAGFDASWELGLFGRSGATRHLARADAGAAAAELADARVSLVAEVVREYLSLRAAQRSQVLLDAAARAAQRKVQLLRVLEHLQLASNLQVKQSMAAAATAAAQQAAPGAAVVQHAQALALLLGKSEPDPAWLASTRWPQLTAGGVDALPANLLRTRPDIRYAEAQVVKAAGELGIAKADLYPRLALGSSLTFAALVKGHTHLGDVNNSFAIGPIINIPLFDWGRRRAVRDAREDQLQAAVLAYRQSVLKGAAEVETDLAALHAAGQRAHSTAQAATATQDSVALSAKLADSGQTDGLQLADAKLAATTTELDSVQAQLAQGLAYVALYKALGGAPLMKGDDDGGNGGSPAIGRRNNDLPSPSGRRWREAPDEGSHSRNAEPLRESEPSPLPLSRGERGKAGKP